MNPQHTDPGRVGFAWLDNVLHFICGNIGASWRVEHKDDDTHGDVTADSLTLRADPQNHGLITGDLSPSQNATYDLGSQATDGTRPFYAWKRLRITDGVDWCGTDTNAAGQSIAAWSDRLSGASRTTVGNVATSQQWTFTDSAGNTILKIGGTVSIGQLASAGGTTITKLVATTAEFTNGLFERDRSTEVGEWIPVAFNAANFTASAGTWTVDSGDQTVFRYMLIGKTLWVTAVISNTDVSNAGVSLRITLPGGFTCAAAAQFIIRISDAATDAAGLAIIAAGSTFIEIYASPAAAGFSSTSSDNTTVFVPVWCEIQ